MIRQLLCPDYLGGKEESRRVRGAGVCGGVLSILQIHRRIHCCVLIIHPIQQGTYPFSRPVS